MEWSAIPAKFPPKTGDDFYFLSAEINLNLSRNPRTLERITE
jgi:hypothetical protein